MNKQIIYTTIKTIITLFKECNYQKLMDLDQKGVFEEDDFKEILGDSCSEVTDIPEDQFENNCHIYELDSPHECLVQFDFWIDNKKSDLTMTCRIIEISNTIYSYAIENFRIL